MKKSNVSYVFLLLAFAAATSIAQEPLKRIASVQAPQVPRGWEHLVGKVVVVEGIAWGLDKGRGFYVIYNGGTVNVPEAKFTDNAAFGRTVRVTGRFVKYPRLRIPPGPAVQLPRQLPEDRFAIERPHIEVIDRVSWPQLRKYVMGAIGR